LTHDTNIKQRALIPLSFIALGVVYGDIGTSPLYALRESLLGLAIEPVNVLGVLSLIFWSLAFVVSTKYLVILLRADNNGEGGILALLALLKRTTADKTKLFSVIAILGAGLLFGDGMLTPAISVISALEGINVVVPYFSHLVIPLTCLILIMLFSLQSFGTEKIGFICGPVLLIWFITLAILGVKQIIQNPVVLDAINPWYAIEFFRHNGWRGYALLGGVFLTITGAEALYADLGHFGKKPIRLAWFLVVLPSLILNYFGQGAYLLQNPDAIVNPFFLIAPTWFSIPLLILATLATIIASQAVITATFSLTKQAVLLGYYPHLSIIQTSRHIKGQIYIPQINIILAIGTLLLILAFKSSNALTHAYGMAVNLVMFLTSLLIAQLAIKKWQWSPFVSVGFFILICAVDLAFLGANLHKMSTGGWVSIVFAIASAFIMYTWNKGRIYLHKTYYMKRTAVAKLLKQFDYHGLSRLPKATAIFITDIYDKSGGSFLHFLKMNLILPEHILIINYKVENIPYVSISKQAQLICLKQNIYKLTLHYGFMDIINIPQALEEANRRGHLPFSIDTKTTTYFMGISNVIASRRKKTMPFFWQEKIFAFLVRNYSSNLNIEFYQLPYERTIAIGTYYMI
jgi:KUP system potassium uptake protein